MNYIFYVKNQLIAMQWQMFKGIFQGTQNQNIPWVEPRFYVS